MKLFNKILITAIISTTIFFSSNLDAVKAAVPTFETNPAILAPTELTSLSTAGNLTKRVAEFIFKLNIESLKRRLLDTVVSQVISGVAGGKPQYVTNWERYLTQNYDLGEQAGLLKARQSGILQGGNYIDALIESRYTPEVNIPSPPQTENRPFTYKNYLESWQPQNNYFGKTIIVDEIVKREAALKQEAAKSEAIAGKGFLSAKNEAGEITTPGSVIGDSVSRAVTSDIDYIVNAEDITAFANALSGSVFNRLLSQGNGGLSSLAQGILSGNPASSIGSFVVKEGGIGSLKNLSLSNIADIGINISQDQILDALDNNGNKITNQRVNQIIFKNEDPEGKDLTDLQRISQDVSNTNSEFNQGLVNDSLGSTLGDIGLDLYVDLGEYEQNKIASYQEVQKAIWYLEDLKNVMRLEITPASGIVDLTDESKFSHLDNSTQQFPRDAQCVPIFNINSISNKESLTQNIDDKINKIRDGIFKKLNDELESFNGEATEEELLISANEKELSHNLFLADMTIKNTKSGNFDILDVLPINLNNSGININKFNRGFCLGSYYYIDRSLYLNFFKNQIQFKFKDSSSGNGNYLGLTISPTNNEIFYFHPEKINLYLENIDKIIEDLYKPLNGEELNSLKPLTEKISEESLARTIEYRQNKEDSALNLFIAHQYVKSIDANRNILTTLKNNMLSLINQSKSTILENANNKLKQTKDQNKALKNLYLAGIAKVDGTNFDITNKLPLNFTQTGQTGEIIQASGTTAPIKISLAPYSGNQNFLGLSVDTRFFLHSNNNELYFNALDSKIESLILNGFLIR